MEHSTLQQLHQELQDSLRAGTLIKASLGGYGGSESQLKKALLRPMQIKGKPHLSVVYRYNTRDITQNLPVDEACIWLAQVIGTQYLTGYAQTQNHELQWQQDRKGRLQVHRRLQATGIPVEKEQGHQRQKQRDLDASFPYWHALGVTDAAGQVIPAMSRKWKQINKFVEVFAHAFAQLPEAVQQQETWHVADFGSGKGYLTFAMREYLSHCLHKTPHVIGIELRDELVTLCNQVVSQQALNGLGFFQGDVRSFAPERLDVMIALHACDVATDYALHTGIRLGASMIISAPCCHKELRPQMQVPVLLQPMLKSGVHLGLQAEMLTDSLRALWLETQGNETKVFEFVSLEHTAKNKMILAVKKPVSIERREQLVAQIASLKAFYGIEQHTLEMLLNPPCSPCHGEAMP